MLFFRCSHTDFSINALLKEMEELNSAVEDSEDSVFLSADDDVYQDSCSAGSGGQSEEERSNEQRGGRQEGAIISRTGVEGQEEGQPCHSSQRTGVQQYCKCQRVYLKAQNSKKTLHLLCIGLTDDDDNHLFSFEDEPLSKLPKSSK